MGANLHFTGALGFDMLFYQIANNGGAFTKHKKMNLGILLTPMVTFIYAQAQAAIGTWG